MTLQPMGDNWFIYAIPVSMEASNGFYRVDVQFNLNGVNLITKHHTIYLPDANLEFSLPGTSTFNADDTLTLNMENTGGKPGDFEIELNLKDSLDKIVLEHKEIRSLEPGGIGPLNM